MTYPKLLNEAKIALSAKETHRATALALAALLRAQEPADVALTTALLVDAVSRQGFMGPAAEIAEGAAVLLHDRREQTLAQELWRRAALCWGALGNRPRGFAAAARCFPGLSEDQRLHMVAMFGPGLLASKVPTTVEEPAATS